MNNKISIITTSFNSEKTIEDTILSVLNQNYENYEHIIVDGNSKDSTLKIIKKYEKKYKGKLKYISEKDHGIYDAMNKGVKLASGDIIGLLNSDDIFYNNKVLHKINKAFTKKVDYIFANLVYVDQKDLSLVKRNFVTGTGKISKGWIPAHPTFYVRKKVYDEIGLYSLKYKIVSDYDFMTRVTCNKKYAYKYLNEYLVRMRIGGTSSSGLKGYINNAKEAYIVLKDNNIRFPFFIIIKRIIKTISQIIIGGLKGEKK